MALLGGVQRCHVPGQIVIPDPALSLWMLIVTTPLKANRVNLAVTQVGVRTADARGVTDLRS
jgi:hypothetical protein